MNYLFTNEFLKEIRSDLKRIANQTKGELTAGDLENEAFFLIIEFFDKYDRKPNSSDGADRDWFLSRLFNKFVKRADYKFKNALRIHSMEDDEGESWALDLPAPIASNPLVAILFREELLAHQSLLDNSYSEAKAYVVTFDNFDYNKEILSDYFYITSNTLDQRFGRALISLQHQRSLFDCIETIDESFNPIRGRQKLIPNLHCEKAQLTLHF